MSRCQWHRQCRLDLGCFTVHWTGKGALSSKFLGFFHTTHWRSAGGVISYYIHIYIYHLKLGGPLTVRIEEMEAETASFLKKMSRHSAGPPVFKMR